jgi:endonuclease G
VPLTGGSRSPPPITSDHLLEQSVELEAGKAARINVFTGPIFSDDDPIYASVQVALSCFKVVVW